MGTLYTVANYQNKRKGTKKIKKRRRRSRVLKKKKSLIKLHIGLGRVTFRISCLGLGISCLRLGLKILGLEMASLIVRTAFVPLASSRGLTSMPLPSSLGRGPSSQPPCPWLPQPPSLGHQSYQALWRLQEEEERPRYWKAAQKRLGQE